jgi:hypothetical protein
MSPAYRRRRVTSGSAALGVALFVQLLATVFALGAVVYRTTATSETSALDPLQGALVPPRPPWSKEGRSLTRPIPRSLAGV